MKLRKWHVGVVATVIAVACWFALYRWLEFMFSGLFQ